MPQYSDYRKMKYRLSGKHTPSFGREKLVNMTNVFTNYFARARMITFSEPLGPKDGETVIRHHGDEAGNPILDLPFETCLFDTIDDRPLTVFEKRFEVETEDCAVFALLVHEVEPGKYDYFSLEREIKGRDEQGFILSDFKMVNIPNYWAEDVILEYHFIVRSLMDRLKAENQSIGTIKKKHRVRIGQGAERRLHTIREIVFVTPKKLREQTARNHNVIVDWSHRWEVRGHYRKIKGVGRYRNGRYGLKGLTWVVPHTKGPEDKPVVRKQRVVQ